MDEAGIPADLVRDIAELAHDPHMRERDAVMEVTDPEKGKVLIPGVFPKMKKAPGRVKFLGARLGEYNQEIFGDYLGLSAEELSELKEKGVI
ncbi:MAG: CoA transferase, partial [Deltaproteobacteria bacterium]|nr:CoA transferase [Deltaproteobacteria bacterium]